MDALLPEAVLRSEKIYLRLLGLYPKNHRQEFGSGMVQVFRDLCRQAYRAEGRRGLAKVWLKTFPDLAQNVILEHEYEMRRCIMAAKQGSQAETNPRWVMGLLISASIIAVGVIASVVIRETGGSVVVAFIIAIAFNLAGALTMDLFGQRDGAVLGAMGLLMLLGALPLLWVSDQTAWIKENPLTLGIIILLAGYMRQRYQKTWPLLAVAIILGAAHILVSFV